MHAEVTFTLWNSVQSNSKMADKTAGQLESALPVSKANAKAFEPRTS